MLNCVAGGIQFSRRARARPRRPRMRAQCQERFSADVSPRKRQTPQRPNRLHQPMPPATTHACVSVFDRLILSGVVCVTCSLALSCLHCNYLAFPFPLRTSSFPVPVRTTKVQLSALPFSASKHVLVYLPRLKRLLGPEDACSWHV